MSQSKDVFPALSGLPCRKCKILPVSGLLCVKCGSLSHPSCVKILKNIKLISDTQIICCDNVDGSSKNELDSVNLSLHSSPTNSTVDISVLIKKAMEPLLEEIKYLRAEIISLKESNIDLVKVLTSANVSDNKSLFSSKLKKVDPIPSSYVGQKRTEPMSKKPGFIISNHEKLHTRNENIRNDDKGCKQTSAVPQTPPSRTWHSEVEDSLSNVSVEEKWTVPRRSRRNRKKQPPPIIGTSVAASASESNFRSTYVKKAWFYVGKVNKETSSDDVKSYISGKLPSDEVTVDKLNTQGSYQSFRVGVKFAYKDTLFKEEFWPQGVVVRRFNFSTKSFLEKTT
ncbi:hypothetical protein Zmor_016021 [Zophobas morio]|uniref:Uncharacterized protein n=1 Tax=Zophobas morio TaxID=2755281 RepID=A0AA38II19_9CUCU|nr:hypothetical protein Zmor_016021 [Zophobas morio]